MEGFLRLLLCLSLGLFIAGRAMKARNESFDTSAAKQAELAVDEDNDQEVASDDDESVDGGSDDAGQDSADDAGSGDDDSGDDAGDNGADDGDGDEGD